MGILLIVPIAALIILLVIVLISSYRVAGPNEALIVSGSNLGSKNVHDMGSGNRLKVIRGGGTIVLPIVQQARRLSLMSSSLEVSVRDVITENSIPVNVTGTVMVKIGSSLEEIATAAEQYLDKAIDERDEESRELLEGHLRAIISKMTVEELNKDRKKFGDEVQEQASADLAKMGLTIVSFTIKTIADDNNYIRNLGVKEAARMDQEAKVALAEANKETDVRRAKASQETRVQQAESERIAKEAEVVSQIALAEAEKNRQLRQAEFDKEQSVALAISEQAGKIQEEKSQKEAMEARLEKETAQREREAVLEAKEVLKQEQENKAAIAKAKAEAEAKAAEITANAKAEAEGIKIKGDAEAQAITLRFQAEADGLKAKAEAMKEMNEAGQFQMTLEMIERVAPQIAASVAQNIASVDSINLYGEGGTDQIMGMTGATTKKTMDILSSMGIQIPELMENFSTRGNVNVQIGKEGEVIQAPAVEETEELVVEQES